MTTRIGRGGLALILAAALLTGCSTGRRSPVPSCSDLERLAIVSQSVPSAAYVPCLNQLPEGWSAGDFSPARGHTRFVLATDRAGARPVHVELTASCDVSQATPVAPRAVGARTSTWLQSISPRYAGTLFDDFAGGCVTYRFDFLRGPHIALMEDLQSAVGLLPRTQLRLEVRRRLGVDLGP